MAIAPQYVFLSSISEAKIQISVEMTCSFLRQFAGNTISAIYTARSISISVVKKSIAIAISVAKFFTQPTVGFYFREFTEIAMNFVNISISVAERGTVGCDSGWFKAIHADPIEWASRYPRPICEVSEILISSDRRWQRREGGRRPFDDLRKKRPS